MTVELVYTSLKVYVQNKKQARYMLGILIAEDEGIVAFDLKRTLRSFGFEKIIVAHSGKEAVEKNKSGNPDVIIMDIMMDHGLDGIEAARKINENETKPIIFVTASTDESTFREAKKVNPIEIIRKPFSEPQLKEAILKAVSKFYRGKFKGSPGADDYPVS